MGLDKKEIYNNRPKLNSYTKIVLEEVSKDYNEFQLIQQSNKLFKDKVSNPLQELQNWKIKNTTYKINFIDEVSYQKLGAFPIKEDNILYCEQCNKYHVYNDTVFNSIQLPDVFTAIGNKLLTCNGCGTIFTDENYIPIALEERKVPYFGKGISDGFNEPTLDESYLKNPNKGVPLHHRTDINLEEAIKYLHKHPGANPDDIN